MPRVHLKNYQFGGTLVEAAITTNFVAILFLTCIGMFQIARVAFTLPHAAAEGARYATTGQREVGMTRAESIDYRVRKYAEGMGISLASSDVSICPQGVTCSGGVDNAGGPFRIIQIAVTKTVPVVLGFSVTLRWSVLSKNEYFV